MDSTKPLAALLLLALASACIDPKCPRTYEKRGDTCYRIRPDGGEDASTAADAEPVVIPPADCFLDWDHDGVGTGDLVDCDLDLASLYRGSADADRPVLVERGGDCDDEDAARAPALVEVCDGVDNDCDEAVDDDASNECGGPCNVVLEHLPGEPCTNGAVGDCAREGSYVCQGERAVRCDAAVVPPSQEVCGDQADNDCDGLMDEGDGIDAPFWYQDCDGDGYAASSTGAVRSCAMPPPRASCSWTAVLPQPETKTNWDCDDSRAAYSPAADYALPPVGSDNYDLNCDGHAQPDPDFRPAPRVCVSSIAEFFNGSVSSCKTEYVNPGSIGCLLWTNDAGAYASAASGKPFQRCPDTPFRVFLAADPFEGAIGCNVASSPEASIWPCR